MGGGGYPQCTKIKSPIMKGHYVLLLGDLRLCCIFFECLSTQYCFLIGYCCFHQLGWVTEG